MNGAGNGKLAAPSTSVLPSKTIVAVALAGRSFLLEPGPLTEVVIGPVAVQRASTETVCNPPRLSRRLANVPLTLTFLRSGPNCVGPACTRRESLSGGAARRASFYAPSWRGGSGGRLRRIACGGGQAGVTRSLGPRVWT